MASTPAMAGGPVELMTDAGQLLQIPLSALYFDATGTLKADHWPQLAALASAQRDAVSTWLRYLAAQGEIVPAPQPPPQPAMVLTAHDPGAQGNHIAVTFSNVRDDPGSPGHTIFDAALTETDTYAAVAPADLPALIGTAPGGGSSPGLVFVSSSGTPDMPANQGPAALEGSGSGPYTLDVAKEDASTAFTLQARAEDAEAAHTSVAISGVGDPSAPDGTFTLVVTWTKAVSGVDADHLADADQLGYEIAVSAPPGHSLAPPAAGTVQLRGGADAAGAKPATATVVAN